MSGSPAVARRHPRICVCATGYPVAGGVSSVLDELLPLLEEEAEVDVLAWRGDQRRPGVRHFPGRWRSPHRFPTVVLYVLAGAVQLYRLHRRRAFTHLLPQDGTSTAAYCLLVGALFGIPVTIMDHGTAWTVGSDDYWRHRRPQASRPVGRALDRIHRRLLGRLAALGARRCRRLLLVGDEVVQAYTGALGADEAKVSRYLYPLDASRFPARGARDPDSPLVVGTVGRLTAEKATGQLVEAALAALDRTGVRGVVRVAGDGPERPSLEAAYGDERRVRCVGALDRHEVAAFLSEVDVFVYAGRQGTNLSMAVMEAMAAGCAVVASTAPASNAWLLAEGRGAPVPPGDGAALERAVARFLMDPGLRRSAALRARDFVSDRCSTAAVKAAVLDGLGMAPEGAPPCPS